MDKSKRIFIFQQAEPKLTGLSGKDETPVILAAIGFVLEEILEQLKKPKIDELRAD